MEVLNQLIGAIKIASKANDGMALAKLKIELASYTATLGEKLRLAKAEYADEIVELTKPRPDGKTLAVTAAEFQADSRTDNKHDGIKYQIEAADRVLTAVKDQISMIVAEQGRGTE